MSEEVVGLMSPETEKTLEQKLVFKNKIIELLDKPILGLLDNKLFHPLSLKLEPDVRAVVIEALAAVIDEMEPIEIGKD